MPTNEAQCRHFTKLKPEEQVTAWQEAVKQAGAKVPSSLIVKDIVQRIRSQDPGSQSLPSR